jgi:hypothetical protein
MSSETNPSKVAQGEIVQRLRALLDSEPAPAPAQAAASFIEQLSRTGVACAVVDVGRPSRAMKPPLGGAKAQLVGWRNVTFHWARIASSAEAIGESFLGGPHGPAFWFLKAFQLFLQLRDIRKRDISDRTGMLYWALWTDRDTQTASIPRSRIARTAQVTFTTWNLRVPDEAETRALLAELESLGCIRLEADTVLLLETVEIQL